MKLNQKAALTIFNEDYWCFCCNCSFPFVVSDPTRVGFVYEIKFLNSNDSVYSGS
jgi:hypothetical protein